MKHFKDLRACLALLKAEHAGDDTGPEQKKHIEVAMKLLMVLRRVEHPTRAQVFRYVREITEEIVSAFIKNHRR